MNNYPDTSLVDGVDCRYIVYGKEVGEQGTPHLQGTIVFGTKKSYSQLIKLLPGCHIEQCKDLDASIEYCKKEGDFTERGDPPLSKKERDKKGGMAEQDKWIRIRKAAEEGRFDDIDPKVRFTQYKAVEHFHAAASKRRKLDDTEEQHLWYFGLSGTGKSRKARSDHPDAYLKMCNKWWDGYNDEEVVLIEDLDKNHAVLCHHLKIWGDRYPYLAEFKGSARKIRPKQIIITSNYSPQEIWAEATDLEPILRRFKTVEFKTISVK